MKKKLLLLFVVPILLTGCSIFKEYNYLNENQLKNTDIVGEWNFVSNLDNSVYVSMIAFDAYGNCGISIGTSGDYGVNMIHESACTYEIIGNRICINGNTEDCYTYTKGDTVMYSGDVPYVKINDDPCIADNYDFCKN